MALNRGYTVEVRQVANGYIVMPAFDGGKQSIICDDERYVFQTFAELVNWLNCHFSHRRNSVVSDQ